MKKHIHKAGIAIISLITFLFLASNSYAIEVNKQSQTPNLKNGQTFLLAKGQYYVPPKEQTKCSCQKCCC